MLKQINLYSNYNDLILILLETIEELCTSGTEVQTQPNGFLRLALCGQKNSENGLFLHIWMPNLPCQKYPHTHVFHLTSRVIKGEIKDMLYMPVIDENGPYQLIKSQCTEESCLIVGEIVNKVKLNLIREMNLTTGDVYEVEKDLFHIGHLVNNTEIAITLMEKSQAENNQPILAVPTNQTIPRKAFSRKQIDQDFAWDVIKKTLRECLSKNESKICL